MKKLLFSIVSLTFAACAFDFSLDEEFAASLTDITIECIKEETISNNTSGNQPFTKHTYLCTGYVGGLIGDCSIRIMHDNFILVDQHRLTIAGNKMQFQLQFAPEWGYLDMDNNTFTVILLDDTNSTLCKTTVVVTKHPESEIVEHESVPYMEYSLSGTSCKWQLPALDNNIIIINSNEELQRYIVSDSGESFPSVDFERYTMIIAHGYSPNGIYEKRIENFYKISNSDLQLDIVIYRDMTDVVEPWNFAILVDKWDRLYNIDLNVDLPNVIN